MEERRKETSAGILTLLILSKLGWRRPRSSKLTRGTLLPECGSPTPLELTALAVLSHSTRCLKPDRSLPWLFQHQGGLECPHSSFFKGSYFPRTLAALCTQRHQGTGPREAVRSSLGDSREGQGLPSSASASPHPTSAKDIFFVHLG